MASKTKDAVVEDQVTDEAPTATEDEREKRTRKPGPKYGMSVVKGDLPTNAKIKRKPGGGRKKVYLELLAPIVADENLHGEWIQVAEFNTSTGAKDVAKAIERGERDIPDGGDWEFQYRRLVEGEGENERRYSVLYAMFTP